MKGNLNLGSISGIKIKVHWTFMFLIVWIVFEEIINGGNLQSILFNIGFVLSVFLCVVLHELGHAITAKRFGVSTKKITLLPIGGVASLDKIPEVPRQEFIVAISGPMVNVLIAAMLYYTAPVQQFINQDIIETFVKVNEFTVPLFIFYLFVVNISLFVFNLIPAFPMDGGRILRALLAMKMDRVKATKIAAGIGQFIAVFFLLIGFLYNPILIFIALFIFLGAYGENQFVQHSKLLQGHKVREAMLTNINTFSPEHTMDDVINRLLASTENNFVVVKNDKVQGVLYHKDIIKNSKNRTLLVKDVMCKPKEVLDINADLKHVYQLMNMGKIHFSPVTDNALLAGAIDLTNLNEFIMLQAKLEY